MLKLDKCLVTSVLEILCVSHHLKILMLLHSIHLHALPLQILNSFLQLLVLINQCFQSWKLEFRLFLEVAHHSRTICLICFQLEILWFQEVVALLKSFVLWVKRSIFVDQELQRVTTAVNFVRRFYLPDDAQKFVLCKALRAPHLFHLLHVLDHFDQTWDGSQFTW